MSRYNNPTSPLRPQDADVYEEVFRPFGVSNAQFATLMSHGIRHRAGEGSIVVQGGLQYARVALILSGEAVAYERKPDGNLGNPVCRYVGKLMHDKIARGSILGAEPEVEVLQSRGSVVGGSAMIDEALLGTPYPNDIIASTPTEWIEWDLHDLQVLIDAPRFRALQASWYHLLYAELIGTLDRAKKARIVTKVHKREEGASPPKTRQLLSLSAFVAVPFFGFGFADNLIMIVCGDLIDAKFGTALGLTTLAAAGLGNWVSDVVGLSLGDAIERAASKLGLSNGGLSPAQEKMSSAKLTTLVAKIIGISLGCFAGMIPLLFLTPAKKEFTKQDLEVFDHIFGKSGVTMEQFGDLMDMGRRHKRPEGHVLVQAGTYQKKAILLLNGEAAAYTRTDESLDSRQGDPYCKYLGRLDHGSRILDDKKVRGSVIGGSLLTGNMAPTTPYPRTIIAETPVEWIEWELTDLQGLMEKETAVQASFLSILYGDIMSRVHKDRTTQGHNTYQALVAAVVADRVVEESERRFLRERQAELQITDEEHEGILAELGWTQEGFEAGSMLRRRSSARHAGVEGASDAEQLRQAINLVQQVAEKMEAA